MNIRSFLTQVRLADRRIQTKREQIERLRGLLDMPARSLSHDKVKTSHNNDLMADTMARIVDMENGLEEQINQMLLDKAKAQDMIDQLDDPKLEMIMEMRYLCGYSWARVVRETGYCERNVFKLHTLALKKIKIGQ